MTEQIVNRITKAVQNEHQLFDLLGLDPLTCDVRAYMAVRYFLEAWPRVALLLPRVVAALESTPGARPDAQFEFNLTLLGESDDEHIRVRQEATDFHTAYDAVQALHPEALILGCNGHEFTADGPDTGVVAAIEAVAKGEKVPV